ncbi:MULTISPECIES: cytochrome P450 [Kitasatospora]|uniref:Putative cytochrome P450 n=1 Tax=Kitasatospora setae (strain ATCC 33774 / DSM 43861 / JCM 3304 / KCC A-0304 / NBRC 14216 / KM-6054) TaxID=452652 RepID=E4NIM3_KITSK|nr:MULTISPECIES: cytochrome P450 [Kitasatospora]BAJ32821.1 putative cytochrome P450 [Kitasatospora setae KM-6054]
MTSTPAKPTRELLFPDLSDDIDARIAWFQHMQKNQPLRFRPEYNLWEVFRYEDVQYVLKNPEEFSVSNKTHLGLPFSFGRADIPDHRFLRGFVARSFQPGNIEGLAPEFAAMVDALLAPARESGRLEVLGELGYPIMERVVGQMFGLRIPGVNLFREWSDQMFGQLIGVRSPDHADVVDLFREQLDERKLDPRDDLMSALLAARRKDDRLAEEKIIHMCLDLATAGNAPLSLLLAYTFQRFCRDPELFQTLRRDPSLIPGAIEEILRFDFSWFNLWRTARHDTVLGGQEIKADQYVVVWDSSANFDEKHFPQADRFDIRRSPNPHLTFGQGMYICLGLPLVRVLGRVVLERLVATFSDLAADPDRPVRTLEQMKDYVVSLDVVLTPSKTAVS